MLNSKRAEVKEDSLQQMKFEPDLSRLRVFQEAGKKKKIAHRKNGVEKS